MSLVSKPGAKPAKAAVSKPTAKGAVGASAKIGKSNAVDLAESTKGVKNSALSGPGKVVAATTLKGISESFPIQALSKLEAKGIEGQTFLLDGGSLRGLKLEARRVNDGESAGFEILFQLTPGKLGPLLEAMKKQEAKATSLQFRELVLGEDGIASFGKGKASVTASTHNAAVDQEGQDSQWVLKLEGPKGGTIEVVHDKAALAVRGLVRINLRGDDATCTKQLDGLVKSLGLAPIFAPPTAKSKQVLALMRVLWQVDHAKAVELSKSDLGKLKPEDIQSALLSAGYTKERIAGLRYEEVYEGHFTVVDPGQAEAMAQAGARYLYSTVTEPAHVLSILKHGQKASLERYKNGLIIDGMSSNSDFATGGAIGVFTRLVTQDAIYRGSSWTGRTYKLLQTHEQLGRTDWHGWNGDYFGKRWDLKSDVNFGVGLVKQIGQNGSYASSNELIFPAGNRPENILRVIATSEATRQNLIEYLKKEGYVPHNGLSLEEFVVLSPKFLVFGKSPYEAQDPEAFVADAKTKAAQGDYGPLQWFLVEGPSAPEIRRALERDILLGKDTKLQDVLFLAAKVRGQLSLGKGFDELIGELEAKGPDGQGMLDRLVKDAAESLLRSGSDKAIELLIARKPTSGTLYRPFGFDDDDFVRILSALAGAKGSAEQKAIELILDLKTESFLSSRHAGFFAFLAKHPLVKPEDPMAFVSAEVDKLKKGETAPRLALFAAQALDPDMRRHVESELIRASTHAALTILKSLVQPEYRLSISGETLKGLIDELPQTSNTRSYLLGQASDVLLKHCHQGLFDLLLQYHTHQSDFGISDQSRWEKIAEAIVPPAGSPISDLGRQILERGAPQLAASGEFSKKLPTLPGLYDLTVPELFFQDALANLSGRGQLQFLYLLSGPEALAPHRVAGIRHLLASKSYEAMRPLERAVSTHQQHMLPLSAAERNELVQSVATEESKESFLKLARIDGRQILADANVEVVQAMEQVLKGDSAPLSRFGLDGHALREALEAAKARTDAGGAAVYGFMLRAGARSFIAANDQGILGHLSAEKVTLEQLGFSPDDAASEIKKVVEANSYYYASSSYADTPHYKQLPAGPHWLLTQGETSADPKVLEAIETALPGWGWNEALLGALVKRIPDLSDEWKARLEAARVKK